MKRVFLLTVVLAFVLCQVDAKTIFVKKGSNGNGSSWEQAIGNLQEALLRARTGDQIWVAAGKYFTTKDGDRTKSFVIPDGITLFGGFAGYESSPLERNLKANLTILSGEIGMPSPDDNAYTVVYTKNASSTTTVDGFIIMGGAAKGSASKNMLHYKGAGWFNEASHGNSSPTIKNCVFINNTAREGAGLYNYASNGTCEPVIEDCQFIKNLSDVDGGAVFNDGNNGTCSPRFSNCLFEGNEATYGAGMLNKADNGQAAPVVRNCLFVANIAYIRGSGIYNDRTASSKGYCEAIMSGCRFEKNSSSVGSEISSRVSKFDLSTLDNTGYKSSGY